MSDNDKKIKILSPSNNEKSSKGKLYLVMGGAIIFIIALGSLSVDNESGITFAAKPIEFIDLTPGEDKDWRTEMQMSYKAIEKSSESLRNDQKESLELVKQALITIEEKNKIIKRLSVDVETLKKRKPVERVIKQVPMSGGKLELPTVPGQEETLQQRIERQMNEKNNVGKANENISSNQNKSVLPPPPGMPYQKSKEFGRKEVETLNSRTGNKSSSPNKPMIFVAREEDYNNEENAVEMESSYEENEFAGFLPPGSFAKVALLTGLDSGTSEYTRSNPQPVLMRVQSNAQLPQGKYQTKSCFVLGSSYGDLSSERIFVQLSRITCMDSSRQMMLTGKLSGYVADSDSIQGLKGKVIRRNGQLLAKSMLAGFASGLSKVAAGAGTTQVTSVGGAINTAFDTSKLLETGGMEGVNSTMELVAKQYSDEAKNMFPVIGVPGGRIGSMVLTQGTKLEWKSYKGKYTKSLEPTNSKFNTLF
jgi:conjugal transfer pilus assembly protein TraB